MLKNPNFTISGVISKARYTYDVIYLLESHLSICKSLQALKWIGIWTQESQRFRRQTCKVPEGMCHRTKVTNHPSLALILRGTQLLGSWSPIACDRVCTLTVDFCKLSSTTAKINANFISFWSHLPWVWKHSPLTPAWQWSGKLHPHNCSPHPSDSGFPTQDSQPVAAIPSQISPFHEPPCSPP